MSQNTRILSDGPLHIEREVGDDTLRLRFVGKSILRDPVDLVLPVLLEALEQAEVQNCRLILDFCGITYMNSSSFTPIVKTLEKARVGTAQMTVRYDSGQKWQSVSFTALNIFATPDGRVAIAEGG